MAIVDAFDDPQAKADLDTYDSVMHSLIPSFPASFPSCTLLVTTSCFQKVNQTGGTLTFPAFDSGWSLEIALDIETAHAVCQDCKILLVEANSDNVDDLAAAVDEAAALGATVISNSYGAAEGSDSAHIQSGDFNTFAPHYRHPGIIVVASSGDAAFPGGPQFPADVNDVVAVGGTTLSSDANTGAYISESVWYAPTPAPASGAGSGCSLFETPQAWQSAAAGWTATGCGTHRGIADVSADADPNSGMLIYWSADSRQCTPTDCWWSVGGTSLSAPLIAATFALAANPGTVANPISLPYAHFRDLHDVHTGVNGSCSSTICKGATGYDGPTGMGTPNGLLGFEIGTPAIGTWSPAAGPAGTSLTINGQNLTQASAVTVGGTPVQSFTVDSDIKITAVVGVGTTGSIQVTTPGGVATSSGTFQFAPTVTSFTPNGGPAGTSVTITGAGFIGATAVTFGGHDAAHFTIDSDTQITATVAAGTTTGPVSVVGPGGTGTSTALYYMPPTITSFTPDTAGVHATVTLTGVNLTGATHVRVNGTSAPYTVVSNTTLTFTVPSGAATGTIQVTTPGGSGTSTGTFTVTPPPTITSLSVSNGPVGTSVTITGTNLTGTVGVMIGSIITVPTSVSVDGFHVVFTIPPGASTGVIRILNPAGSATSPGAFTVTP